MGILGRLEIGDTRHSKVAMEGADGGEMKMNVENVSSWKVCGNPGVEMRG